MTWDGLDSPALADAVTQGLLPADMVVVEPGFHLGADTRGEAGAAILPASGLDGAEVFQRDAFDRARRQRTGQRSAAARDRRL